MGENVLSPALPHSAPALRLSFGMRLQKIGLHPTLLARLVSESACTLVTRIGHVAVLYRAASPIPRLVLPHAQV